MARMTPKILALFPPYGGQGGELLHTVVLGRVGRLFGRIFQRKEPGKELGGPRASPGDLALLPGLQDRGATRQGRRGAPFWATRRRAPLTGVPGPPGIITDPSWAASPGMDTSLGHSPPSAAHGGPRTSRNHHRPSPGRHPELGHPSRPHSLPSAATHTSVMEDVSIEYHRIFQRKAPGMEPRAFRGSPDLQELSPTLPGPPVRGWTPLSATRRRAPPMGVPGPPGTTTDPSRAANPS